MKKAKRKNAARRPDTGECSEAPRPEGLERVENAGSPAAREAALAEDAARSGDSVTELYQTFLAEMPIVPVAFERGQMIIRKGLIDSYAPTPYNAFAGLETWTSLA